MRQPLEHTRFLMSASDHRQLGPSHAEVVFVGRSNVGKSSLLNALVGRRALARVSNTPGRTRLINVFVTGDDRWIVDLPGYGYAAGPKRERQAWQGMIEGYLTGRASLRLVFVLVDAYVGPTRLDHEMIGWLRAEGLPYRVVATKADKVKSSRHVAQRRDIARDLAMPVEDVAWVSAEKNSGIVDLRQEVAAVLELA